MLFEVGLRFIRSALIALCVSGVAFAQGKNAIVKVAVGGQPTYEIVVEADDSNSDRRRTDRKPGIYAITKKASRLLLPGVVEGVGRDFNGILSNFGYSPVISMAVVDKKLVLFSSKTSLRNKSSFVVLGEGDAQVLDGVHQRPLALDGIDEPRKIAISHRSMWRDNININLIALSLKQKTNFGDGITVLLNVDLSSSREIRLLSKPFVIDYRYRPHNNLASLMRYSTEVSDFGILSPLHLEWAMQQSEAMADAGNPIVVEWRKHIRALITQLNKKQSVRSPKKEAKRSGKSATKRKATRGGARRNDTLAEALGSPSIPTFDALKGQVTIRRPPGRVIASRFQTLYQEVNPLTRSSTLALFGSNEDVESRLERLEGVASLSVSKIHGQVDFEDKKFLVREIETGRGVTIASVAGRNFVLFQSGLDSGYQNQQIFHFDIGPSFDLESGHRTYEVTARYFLRRPSLVLQRQIEHLIVLSYRNSHRRSFTEVLVFEELGGGMRLLRREKFASEFYDQKSLDERFHVLDSRGEEHEIHSYSFVEPNYTIGFDGIAPNLSLPEGSRKRRKRHVDDLYRPLLDIVQSTEEKPVQVYRETRLRRRVVNDIIDFRHFEPRGSISNQTGFYVLENKISKYSVDYQEDKVPWQFVPGVPLGMDLDFSKVNRRKRTNRARDKHNAAVEIVRESVSLNFSDGLNTNHTNPILSFIPFNPKPGTASPQGSFSVLMTVTPLAGHSMEFFPQTKVFHLPVPYSQLAAIKVVHGRKKSRNQATVLFFFKGDKKSHKRTKNGGVFAVPFDVTYDSRYTPYDVKFASREGAWISKEPVSPAEIRNRIFPDGKGSMYWVDTPEKERSNRHYAIRSLDRPDVQIKVNQGEYPIYLRYDQGYRLDQKGFLGYSEWSIATRYSLKERVPDIDRNVKDLGLDPDASERKKKSSDLALFPEFEAFLEELAKPRSKSEHQVLLVEPQFKDFFQKILLARLVTNEKGMWSVVSKASVRFSFNLFRPGTQRDDIDRQLEILVENSRNERVVLYADIKNLLDLEEKSSTSSEDNGSDDFEDGDNEEELEEENASSKKGSENIAYSEDKLDAKEGRSRRSESLFLQLAREGKRGRPSQVAKRSKDIATIILATPEEWRLAQEEYPKEVRAGVFDSYRVNTQFLSSSWTVWPPSTAKADKEIRTMAKAPVTRDEHQVFQNLEDILLQAAQRRDDMAPRHRVIIVPEELKGLVNRLVLSRWATNSARLDGPWSHRNRNLALFRLHQGTRRVEIETDEGVDRQEERGRSQEVVFDNFEAIVGAKKYRKPVLLGGLDDVLRLGRPEPKEGKGFMIRDPALRKDDGVIDVDVSNGEPSSQGEGHDRRPHVLWMIATEGRKVQPRKFTSQPQSHLPSTDVLLFGTAEEWERLRQEIAFENRFGLEDHFDVVQLEAPSKATRYQLIESLFERPEVRSLDYRFEDLKQVGQVEARRGLIEWIVDRTTTIARNKSYEPTSAFVRMYSELRRALTEDLDVRRSKLIDSNTLSRMLARVFPLPLAIRTLREGDYLRKLQDPDKAALDLQTAGYDGPLEFKSQVVKTILSQTKDSAGRPIPSSTILFGGTSTGKTYFFETLIKYLGIKEYDISRTNNEEAGAFILRLQNIVDKPDPANPDLIGVDDALEHLSNFLAQPRGYRGFVLFDDMHKAASTQILKKVMTYMQSLFDAKGGYIRVRNMSTKEIHEIPVRNLNVFMTLNPRRNRDVVDRYVEDESNIVQQVVAGLIRDDYEIEDSVFARWSDIVNVDEFPRDAKVSSLVNRIRASSRQEYIANPQLVLVHPDVLKSVVNAFPESNAREFLSIATNALTSVNSEVVEEAPLYILMPRDKNDLEGEHRELDGFDELDAKASGLNFDASKRAQVERFVRRNTIVKTVSRDHFGSRLELSSFMAEGFRVQVWESLIQRMNQSPEFAGNTELRRYRLAPFFLAIHNTAGDSRRIPLRDLNLKPGDFGDLSLVQQQRFFESIQEADLDQKENFFRLPFAGNKNAGTLSLGSFLGQSVEARRQRTRQDVLHDTARALQGELSKILASYLRLSSLDQLPSSEEWIASLKEGEPDGVVRDLGRTLLDGYTQFVDEFSSHELAERSSGTQGQRIELTQYETARLYLMIVDRAISRLPWGRAGEFFRRVLSEVQGDPRLNQKYEFQYFLFESFFSPMRTTTRDFVYQSVESSRDFKAMSDAQKGRLEELYQRHCESYLIPGAGQ